MFPKIRQKVFCRNPSNPSAGVSESDVAPTQLRTHANSLRKSTDFLRPVGTIIGRLLERFPQLEFSISATSRAPRGTEADGREYYFLSNDDFKARAAAGEFVEWEEVYAGTCYGTLRSELKRIWDKGHVIVFDVDVKGGVNLKRIFGAQALSVFVMPPSVDELQRRLEGRGTDSPETIARRVAKAEQELAFAPQFDRVVVNDCLATAVAEAERITEAFIG